jgi:hypothetical protein
MTPHDEVCASPAHSGGRLLRSRAAFFPAPPTSPVLGGRFIEWGAMRSTAQEQSRYTLALPRRSAVEYLLKALRDEVQALATALRIEVEHIRKNDPRRQEKIVELARYERWAKVLSQVLDQKT